MEILIFAVIISAFLLIVVGLVMSEKKTIGMRYIPDNALADTAAKRLFQTEKLARLIPFTRRFLEKTGLAVKLKGKIDAAHVRVSAHAFFNIKLILMVTAGALSVILAGKFDPVIFVLAVAISYIIPDFYLKNRLARRKREIVRVLPETVDLLGLCIEAGLDFTNSVKWVVDKTPLTPLLEELSFVMEEIKWGKSRVQSLKDMSRRLDIPEISSFVQTIIQAERMGTPVAEAFTILSEDVRAQRFHRGERIALQAPIKILLPLIFFIMPVIGIVIGGPILLQFMSGGLLSGIK
ncbi:MAG: type II secretion system F family protein [Candidatus Omnitrophica bacterium]|nr:type II secretion system F family protein [Candidatus Omnitrophota bacterium]